MGGGWTTPRPSALPLNFVPVDSRILTGDGGIALLILNLTLEGSDWSASFDDIFAPHTP
jgi:hypothetical protein